MLKLKQPDPDEVAEKTNDLNAPLMPDLPASDETGFRPLNEEEKKDFRGLVGRQRPSDFSGSGISPKTCLA